MARPAGWSPASPVSSGSDTDVIFQKGGKFLEVIFRSRSPFRGMRARAFCFALALALALAHTLLAV